MPHRPAKLESSNGRFDYAAFVVWSGAPVHKIAPTSRMYWPDGHFDVLPTPVIVQENSISINAANMEGGHCNTDAISHIHFGGSYYGAIDRSVQFIDESPGIPSGMAPGTTGSWVWQSRAPSGEFRSMGSYSAPYNTWGVWEHQ